MFPLCKLSTHRDQASEGVDESVVAARDVAEPEYSEAAVVGLVDRASAELPVLLVEWASNLPLFPLYTCVAKSAAKPGTHDVSGMGQEEAPSSSVRTVLHTLQWPQLPCPRLQFLSQEFKLQLPQLSCPPLLRDQFLLQD